MILNWEVLLAFSKNKKPCRGIWIDWEHWAVINGMKLNMNKCQILHLGQSNARHKYKRGEEWLESSLAERDLGLLTDNRVNRSQQCALAARRPNCILGCIKHRTTNWSKNLIIPL